MHSTLRSLMMLAPVAVVTVACGGSQASAALPATTTEPTVAVVDTTLTATFAAAGTALPVFDATISTKLMGSVTAVLVTEGARVASGDPLVRLDAADLDAKARQAASNVAAAEATQREAQAMAIRIRALYADSAAPKAQLDAVETGLARASAGLEAAKAGVTELNAVRDYSVLRAPFGGVVTRRFVDPGDFAGPGAPLVTIQDASRLRIAAAVPAAMAMKVKAGAQLDATIEGERVRATVEGVVPSAATMYTVNAIVANGNGSLPSGSAATVMVPSAASERVLLVPATAIVRQGDLTGVRVVRDGAPELRWVRLGNAVGDRVIVRTGLQPGEQVVVAGGER
ncbi:MAG: efflux RND transporter periplasmic adaptor subunit [Gemmatimonadaceae bacterium]|nr:efflux RND transporter periplasmic adaptor subunit [Gemmatimonadaceae bacterium]